MEHIELAGVHSGDSACVLPPLNIPKKHVETIEEYTKKIAVEMNVLGLMNMQYAIEGDTVYVLEANPRASRTVPLVSKVLDIGMVRAAVDIMTLGLTGRPSPVPALKRRRYPHYGVKEAVFPFNMFHEVDPVLGPEMRSTGEVLGMSESFGEAYFKAQEATQTKLPLAGTVFLSVNDRDKPELPAIARIFADCGFDIVATDGTHKLLQQYGVPSTRVNKRHEGEPNIIDLMSDGKVQLVVNTPAGKAAAHDDSYIRKAAIKGRIPYVTTMAAALASAEGIAAVKKDGVSRVRSIQEFHKGIV